MPSLNIKNSDGTTRTSPLFKRITTVGRSPDCDIVLDDPHAPENALHLVLDGEGYRLATDERPVLVNGRRRDQHLLVHGDVLGVGDTELVFSAEAQSDAPPPPLPSPSVSVLATADALTSEVAGIPGRELAALRRLTAFSERLLQTYEVDTLLENLMDEVIEVTRADKGFLILLENGELRVKVARNIARENIEQAVERVSDSIIQRVIKTSRPLVLADALDDPELSASTSVVNLKLLSVMCTPLMHKGELFGLIYVGNDRLVNRFEKKSLDTLTVFAAQASLILQNAMLVNELKLDNTELRKRLDDAQYGGLVGTCSGMREVYKRIDKVALTDISVLISGETGTGKELIARELHQRSQRRSGPFVTINCGAIPENLLESELFGHAKGAFTGAVATKQGRFQAAIGGTLFLDEIGEMPLALQVKLLRALQDKIVHKVGDNRPEPVDIRVVAATNKVLEDEVKRGTFREDLYYRLNVVNLRLPPLRERGDDVIVLAKYFLQRAARELGARTRGFSPGATVAMRKYGWPGNVRELENRIKKAVVLADKALLTAEDLDLSAASFQPVLPLAQAKEDFQKRYINEVLDRNNGNRTKTAKDLGVDPRTIFRHLEKLEAERLGRKPPDDELEELT